MSSNNTASYLNNELTLPASHFQSISRNADSELEALSLLEWMGTQENISFQRESNDAEQASKMVLSLIGAASDYFPLLRGIIALGQPLTFIFQVMAGSRTFVLQYAADQESEVKSYLNQVFSLINAEIRFKQVLRKVIVNQEKFEKEERLLFNSL
jgi:hypothetical protein